MAKAVSMASPFLRRNELRLYREVLRFCACGVSVAKAVFEFQVQWFNVVFVESCHDAIVQRIGAMICVRLIIANRVKFVKSQHIKLWKRNLLKAVEMIVFGNNIIGTCCNSAINKLVVVLVNVGKQMKVIVRLSV
jgi:hypothetical protein